MTLKQIKKLSLSCIAASLLFPFMAHAQQLETAPDMPEDTQTVPAEDIDPNLFFDSDARIPPSQLNVLQAPKRVDPAKQLGSSLIIVEENNSANSLGAKLTAAKRATELGRYEAALEIYTGLEEEYPKNKQVLLGKAVSLQNLGHEDHAIAAYESLLDLDSENLDAHINMLGIVAKKYPAVALQRLQELKDKHKNHQGIISQMAYVQAGMGRYKEALNNYGVLAAQNPKNTEYLLNMAIVADKAGYKKEALKYYQEALDVDTIYGGKGNLDRSAIFDRIVALR